MRKIDDHEFDPAKAVTRGWAIDRRTLDVQGWARRGTTMDAMAYRGNRP